MKVDQYRRKKKYIVNIIKFILWRYR